MSVNSPTAPTIEEWELAGSPSGKTVWDLARRQIAYLRSRPAESPELTDEMVEAVRDAIRYLGECSLKNKLRAAFASVLNPPAPPKDKTVREKMDDVLDNPASPISWTPESREMVHILADALDALTDRIGKMEKEKP